MKLFVTENCPRCELVKRRIKECSDDLLSDIQIVDIGTAEGLAQAAYYGVVTMTAPVLVVDEPQVITDLSEIVAKVTG